MSKPLTAEMISELLDMIDADQARRTTPIFRPRGKSLFEKWLATRDPDVIEHTPWFPLTVISVDECGCIICGSRDCPSFKNSAAMCPGPAP